MTPFFQYFHPYHEQTFFGFFQQFFYRLLAFIQGKIGVQDIVSDEIQILVLIAVSSSSAMVGVFLMLRRMTMLANALSHTILMGIVLAYVFTKGSEGGDDGHLPLNAMLIASLGMGMVTAFLTEFLTKVGRLQEDASTGLVFTSLFALGIILVTVLTRDAHIGIEAVMGNVDALHIDDCKFVYGILLGNLLLLVLFFKEFKMTTFDSALAVSLGFSAVFYNYLLMAQVSATTIGAFRAVGVLMVLAFMTGPVLIARLLTHDLKKLICLSVFFGVLSSFIGVAFSRHILTVSGLALSTAGIVVCTIGLTYLLTLFITHILSKGYNRALSKEV